MILKKILYAMEEKNVRMRKGKKMKQITKMIKMVMKKVLPPFLLTVSFFMKMR